MNKNDYWDIVHESDLETGEPTLWARKISLTEFIWISLDGYERYNIYDDMSLLHTCKSLASAKRWVYVHVLND